MFLKSSTFQNFYFIFNSNTSKPSKNIKKYINFKIFLVKSNFKKINYYNVKHACMFANNACSSYNSLYVSWACAFTLRRK